jgi:uncharacterized membrane protein (DUF2068 family)
MSLDKPDLHIRLDDRVMLELKILADARCEPISKVATDLITRALMGEPYALRLAAARMIGSGLLGKNAD